MNSVHAGDYMNSLVERFPERASGEALCEHVVRKCNPLVKSSRPELIDVLGVWVKLRSEPKTMLAVEIAATYRIHELIGDIEHLLAEVTSGVTFKEFYAVEISNALSRVSMSSS